MPPKLITMRNCVRIILLLSLLFLGVQSPVYSHTRLAPEKHHFMWAAADFGYATLLNYSTKTVPNPQGFSPALSGGYRIYYNNFILQTGLGFRYGYYRYMIADDHVRLDMLDTEGDPFVMHALVRDCKDVSHMLEVGIPLSVGYEKNKFYFLVGVKPNFVFFGQAKSQALLTTYGEYDRYVDDFVSMHNHSFIDDEPIESDWLKLPFDFNITGHIEVGLRLDQFNKTQGFEAIRGKLRYYIAFYAESGRLINFGEKPANTNHLLRYEQKPNEELKFYVTPALMSFEMQNASVNPMTIGVKFTCLFSLPDEPRQKIYDANNSHVIRNNNQVIRQ